MRSPFAFFCIDFLVRFSLCTHFRLRVRFRPRVSFLDSLYVIPRAASLDLREQGAASPCRPPRFWSIVMMVQRCSAALLCKYEIQNTDRCEVHLSYQMLRSNHTQEDPSPEKQNRSMCTFSTHVELQKRST